MFSSWEEPNTLRPNISFKIKWKECLWKERGSFKINILKLKCDSKVENIQNDRLDHSWLLKKDQLYILKMANKAF